METYIRFQTQLRCEDTGRPAGIFVAAGRVECKHDLPDSTKALLCETLAWFNRNLKAPTNKELHWKCLFWFRSESQEVMSRMWELAYLLEDEGVLVRKLRTTQPGMIVYRDKHQVAAVPNRKSNALRV